MALPTMNKEQWRGVAIETRQRYMATQMHIHHPAFIRITKEIKRRMNRCINENSGAAILCLASSGAGKTHTRTFLKKRWPDEHSAFQTKVPVIAFDVPTSPNPRSMSQALLRSLGDASWKMGTASELLDRIIHLLPQIETKLIIIDNLQDVPEKRRIKGILEIGNWIRHLIDDGKRLVVLFGTPSAKAIIENNAQLRRRTAKQLNIDYFHFEPAEEQAKFMRVLYEIDKQLPLAELSDLNSHETAQRIHYATFGIQDYIFQLLIEAVGIAVQAQREKIELADLSEAFCLIFQDATPKINPFSEQFIKRPLTLKGEPFHNWFDQSNPPLQGRKTKETKV